jgi:hypothetical protein
MQVRVQSELRPKPVPDGQFPGSRWFDAGHVRLMGEGYRTVSIGLQIGDKLAKDEGRNPK